MPTQKQPKPSVDLSLPGLRTCIRPDNENKIIQNNLEFWNYTKPTQKKFK